MKTMLAFLALLAPVSGCGALASLAPPQAAPDPAVAGPSGEAVPDAGTAPAGAAVSGRLGTTIASLGAPAEPGLWLKTPLVTTVRPGRVDYPAGGTTLALELRPSGGAPGSGSRISLQAMRGLGAPLAGLPELVVHAE